MKDFTCDRCKEPQEFEDMAYLGAFDPKDTACSPFQPLLHVCRKCWTAEDQRKLDAGLPLQ